jgi:hypothetical protein
MLLSLHRIERCSETSQTCQCYHQYATPCGANTATNSLLVKFSWLSGGAERPDRGVPCIIRIGECRLICPRRSIAGSERRRWLETSCSRETGTAELLDELLAVVRPLRHILRELLPDFIEGDLSRSSQIRQVRHQGIEGQEVPLVLLVQGIRICVH